MNLTHLPIISTLSDCVTVVQKDQAKIIRIQHAKAEAAISLFGGHVISFKPLNSEELIWTSEDAIFDGKTPLRGGIPVCWPWFARIAEPAHGFCRTSEWDLVEHRENDQGVILRLGLRPSKETLAIWPHQFAAFLDVEVSEQLKVTLDITNTDDHAWAFSGALHSYFNIANILDTQITGMGEHYIDKLQDGKMCLGGDTLAITSGVDRVYTHPTKQVCISDPQNQRTISVENQGDTAAVIWNPWELAQGMTDMKDEAYANMVCVESTLYAETLEGGHTLEPGESYLLSTKIGLKA
ncbi:MAG: D-hexose-6-phosphate mutarotase [Vibrio litoralis]|uniref:D-hexose-6-phosphate mutarotase n=1 Tax=Vibrio litoralis TaxID=335972 RepID=UPI003F989AB9